MSVALATWQMTCNLVTDSANLNSDAMPELREKFQQEAKDFCNQAPPQTLDESQSRTAEANRLMSGWNNQTI